MVVNIVVRKSRSLCRCVQHPLKKWLGKKVPEVLLSGNHRKINEWKKKKSIRITKIKRPDLLKKVAKK